MGRLCSLCSTPTVEKERKINPAFAMSRPDITDSLYLMRSQDFGLESSTLPSM